MYCFCTYFDRHYLSRGLALYRSLRRHCPAFELWVLCMDAESHRILVELALPGIHPISIADFERDDDELRRAKDNRSRVEYYFTCTPSLPLYILKNWLEVNLITYLDADLFFFASPQPIFDEIGAGSITITAHRFPDALKDRERYGIYNVGWLSLRRDDNALACLQWWRERCIEWCFDREEDGRFADQKYLDDWPTRFQNVVVLEHPGANVAPWNLADHHIALSRKRGVTIDGEPLIFFHFHALKRASLWIYDPGWIEYGIIPPRVVRSDIYAPYLRTVFAVRRQLSSFLAGDPISTSSRAWTSADSVPVSRPRRLARRLRELSTLVRETLAGKLMFHAGR